MLISSIPSPTLALAEQARQAMSQEIAKINWLEILMQSASNLLSLWPLWLIVGLTALPTFIYKTYLHIRLSKAGMYEIDKMTGEEFEQRLCILFRNLGYQVTFTGKPSGDYGVDLVIEKCGRRTAIQAKCYKHKLVGEDAIREVYTGMHHYNCMESQVITNSNYSRMAWRLARSNNVKLWNRNNLASLLLTEKFQISQQ
jgi:restriction system protein